MGDIKETDKIMAFDTLFTTNHIKMLKVLVPYLNSQMQKYMAIYIRYLELRYAITYLQTHPYPVCGCFPQESCRDMGSLFKEIIPFCDKKQKEQMEQFQSMFKAMDTAKELSKTMEVMSELFPQSDDSDGSGPSLDNLINLFAAEAGSDSAEGTSDMMQTLFSLLGGNHEPV